MKINIGLVQINNSFSGQNYFPYTVGLLQAYAQKYAENNTDLHFLLPIYKRVKVEFAVEQLSQANMVFFSAYVWNIKLSLAIARKLKALKNDIVIVFGGPQVPNDAEDFLRENPFIDLACHNEGELIAKALVEHAMTRNWDKIPSSSYWQDGLFHQNSRVERLKDLTQIPSPYLSGVFDKLIEAYPTEQWLVMWETNRGCPFSCTFCDWGSATQSKVFLFEIERLVEEINWFRKHRIEFIFCCDANFGILKRDLEIVNHVVQSKLNYGYPKALSVQNTKNARDRAYLVQKTLADAGLNKGVTISMQSVDETTLKLVKRDNISTAAFQELQHRFTQDGIETYTDMILAMPGETYDSFVNGIATIIEHGQHNRIQFGNLSILPNAEMGQANYQKKFGLVVIESKIINLHGSLLQQEEIDETQQLVIATDSMNHSDWVKTRAFCWMTALLYFDKLLQIPLLTLHHLSKINFRELLEIFILGDLHTFPIFQEIKDLFFARAREIQNGGPEYHRSENWLNIWWPDDEWVMIWLCSENKLGQFYQEAEQLIKNFLDTQSVSLPTNFLHQVIEFNKKLIKLPMQEEDEIIACDYNILEYYQGIRQGKKVDLEQIYCNYRIDRSTVHWENWQQWCQEVVWYGNKKGAYLFPITPLAPTQTSAGIAFVSNILPGIPGHH